MSISSEILDSGSLKMTRAGDKSSFSHTCTLLSQYLKMNGTFGDLSLGMPRIIDADGSSSTIHQTAAAEFPTTINLFPQESGFGSSPDKEEVSSKTDLSAKKLEPAAAQMTIFYAGQVIVFNDFPADRANEIMQLASGSSSQIPNAFASNLVQKPADLNSSTSSASTIAPNFGNNLIQGHVQRSSQPVVSDLPIARKASLTRFLEKRKDRISAKAPYQTSNSAAPSSSKPSESKMWLGLAAPSSPQPFQHLL